MTAELVGSFVPRSLPGPGADVEFEVFYQRYHPCVLGYAWRVFGATDAEDIAQETMARAYLHFKRLDPGRDPWPWLCVVARHVGTDIVRAHARMVAVEEQRLADMPSDERDAPHERAVASDDRRLLTAALAGLSAGDRQVLRLREYDDLSVADIAALLDRSETAVRQQLFRARRRLADRFRAVAGSFGGLVFVFSPMRLRRAWRGMTHGMQAAAPMATGTLMATTSLLAVATTLAPAAPTAGTPALAIHATRASESWSVAGADRTRSQLDGSPAAAQAAAVNAVQPAPPKDRPAPRPPVDDVTSIVHTETDPPDKPLSPGDSTSHRTRIDTPVGPVYVEVEAHRHRYGVVCETTRAC